MSDRLQELAVFVRAAESGSFSRAARELGLSQPSVSRIVGELERRLGVTLLLRTTRRIALTDAGALFLERARELLAGIEDAEDAARGVDSLRGTIRLALPVMYGMRAVIPRLPAFLARHPLLQVELTVSDQRQDLVAEGADVAIRLGKLDDSVFGARKLATLERFPVAAPSYLKARGTPRTPAELSAHDCIFGPGASERGLFGRENWSFTRNSGAKRGADGKASRDASTVNGGGIDGVAISVEVRGRVHTSSGSGVFASVLAGLGIAIVSRVMCGPEIESGALVPLLASYVMAPVEVHAVFPGGPRPSAKVRAFVDHLAAEIGTVSAHKST